MYKSLLVLLLTLSSTFLFAQDTLVKIDSSRTVVKLKSVTGNKITYVRYNDQDGAVYEVSRRHVARIIHADGTVEHFGYSDDEVLAKTNPNIVSLTTSDIITGVITAHYERLLAPDIGVRAILSMGLLGPSGAHPTNSYGSYYYSRYKLFSAGIDLHYYAYRGSKFSYYTGSLLEYGRVRRTNYWYGYPYPYPQYESTKIVDYAFAGITNGLTIHAGARINLDMFTSIGWRHVFENGDSDFSARLGMSIGYRF